jgi:hypothetical protein
MRTYNEHAGKRQADAPKPCRQQRKTQKRRILRQDNDWYLRYRSRRLVRQLLVWAVLPKATSAVAKDPLPP